MKFKIGDTVTVKDFEDYTGALCEVVKIDRDFVYSKVLVPFKASKYNYEVGSALNFRENDWEKLPLDNPLNRKLYPNRKEWNGHLIPAKAAAKLKEQSKE